MRSHMLSLAASIVLLCGCQRQDNGLQKPPDKGIEKAMADDPAPFGYKCAWLAVRTDDPKLVATCLGLSNVKPSTWVAGIDAAYQGEVFLTPILKDWVLAASVALPEFNLKGQEDRLSTLLADLGKAFPDVQYFATHRVVEYHGWARVIDGKFVRKYAFVGDRGETKRNEGDLSSEEKKLGLIYGDAKSPREEDVMSLARLWSIDPSTLDTQGFAKSSGFVGQFTAK